MLQLCPSCFAEVLYTVECPFCGAIIRNVEEQNSLLDDQEMSREIIRSNLQSLQSRSVDALFTEQIAPQVDAKSTDKNKKRYYIELAGLPLDVYDWKNVPSGALFLGRYTTIEYKQELQDGFCYIVLDQSLGRYCFLSIWLYSSHLWKYHRAIQFCSPVQFVSTTPYCSAFFPQEGLPLENALQDIGWNHGKIWEVFRQLCLLLDKIHQQGTWLGYVHPSNLWVTPQGFLEFTIEPSEESIQWKSLSMEEEIRNVIRVLGWLFEHHWSIDWKSFPLKMRKLLQAHWSTPQPVLNLWKEIDYSISHAGWFLLSQDVRNYMLEYHAPNCILLQEEIVQIPSTAQLCVWNAVRPTWRLLQGQILLESSWLALYENGFIQADPDVPLFGILESVVRGTKISIPEGYSLQYACIEMLYGNKRVARELLEKELQSTQNIDGYLLICRALFHIQDLETVEQILAVCTKQASFVIEFLEIASFYRWECNDVETAERYLLEQQDKIQNSWEWLDFSQAWMVLGREPARAMTWLYEQKEIVSHWDEGERVQWYQELEEKFGDISWMEN